jgi:hypothetical protein
MCDPFDKQLLTLLFDTKTGIIRPQDPENPHFVPEEIHFLLNGLAGLAVDVSWGGFGDYSTGFSHKIVSLDAVHGTNIAERIYLVPRVQAHVVDGVASHSLHYPNPSPHWIEHRGMFFRATIQMQQLLTAYRTVFPEETTQELDRPYPCEESS